ncbi:Speckle-type POZ protein [Araneus ventricosus]|uniref:Speckle-type POZ protein n=1 Tax=Araneus ventricosus TaxID=182803 RepID=A0A4Y2P9W5_ARAVE|nr:Speckle-type POZ protein [Araneus ventricosus]
MASEIQNGKKEFSFTWRIENISYSWHKTGDKIISPAFVVGSMERTCWTLRLHPRGRKNEDYMSFYLYREKEDKGPEKISLNYELSFLTPDGSPVDKDAPKIKGSFAKNMSYGHPRSVNRDEIFVHKKHLYLHEDSITVYCRMWKGEGTICDAQQAFARTRIGVQHVSMVEAFQPKDKILPLAPIFRAQKEIAINISHGNEMLSVDVISMEKGIKYTTCKLSVLNSTGNVVCENHSSWFDEDGKELWRCPIPPQKYDPNSDTLCLLCEFSFSSGIDYEKIEEIKYGIHLLRPILNNMSKGNFSSGPNIVDDLKSLYDKRILSDAKIKTTTKIFPVHRVMLYARSSKFRMIFKNYTKEKNVLIEMLDLEEDTVKRLLLFLYTDTVEDLQWEIAAKLYHAASKYQFLKLKGLCSSFLIDKLNATNASQLLLMADTQKDSNLKRVAEDFILKYDEQIFGSEEWDTFTDAQPQLAAKTMGLKYKMNKDSKKIDRPPLTKITYGSIVDDLKFLYTSQTLNDVEIKTKKTTFPAHITVLSARSPVFRELFQTSLKESVEMEDVEDDIVRRLLLFLYTDVMESLQWNIAKRLYCVAVEYKVERLKIKCSSFFMENINSTNATEILVLADQQQDSDLKENVEKFILRNEREMYGSKEWVEFAEKNPDLAVHSMLMKYRKNT